MNLNAMMVSRRTPPGRRALLVTLSVLAAAACGDDSVGVLPPVDVAVVPWSLRVLSLSDTVRFEAYVTDEAGHVSTDRPVLWEVTGDPTLRALGDGVFVSIANGTSTVVARAEGRGGRTYEATAGVVVQQQPRAIRMNTDRVDLWSIAETSSVSVEVVDAQGTAMPSYADSVTWNSLDPRVVRVDGRGQVVSVGDGETRVTAWMASLPQALTGEVVVSVASTFDLRGCFTVADDPLQRCYGSTIEVRAPEAGEGR